MATYANQSKSSTTFSNEGYSNTTSWSKPTILWSDNYISWSAFRAENYDNSTKSSTSFVNVTKN